MLTLSTRLRGGRPRGLPDRVRVGDASRAGVWKMLGEGWPLMQWRGKSWVMRALGLVAAFVLAPVMAGAMSSAPMMFGTDEDTGLLLRVEDYATNPQVTSFGLLSINDGGTPRPFPDTDTESGGVMTDIESFALNETGYAFMVGNSDVDFSASGGGSYLGPHLYRLKVFNADGSLALIADDATGSGGYNALESLGRITGIGSGEINGIDFDPISKKLFGVLENGGRDDLLLIDPITAVATPIATSMDGTDDIEDIQFDSVGNLFMIDDDGGVSGEEDVLFKVTLDRSGALPSLDTISVVNLTGDDERIEAIGYDFVSQTMVAFSDENDSLYDLNMNGNGYTVLEAIGYSDVEGIDFVPTPTGLPVPEPTTALLLGGGLVGLSAFRKIARE